MQSTKSNQTYSMDIFSWIDSNLEFDISFRMLFSLFVSSAGSSPIRHLNVGLFKTEIQKMLTRTESTPLLR